MKKPFVHLHTHSHYSLLDGLSKVDELVALAKSYGMNALALTDHGAMYGAIDFYKTCKKADIKPIIGVEVYVAMRSHTDKESGVDNKRYHLTLLAKNLTGYKNLIKLTTIAHLQGFYYKPRVDKKLLAEYAEGIICLSGCPGSEFIQYLKNGRRADAKALLEFYIASYGKEHVFVEIMNHKEVDWYVPLVPEIVALAKEVDLPLVATWDSHYLKKDDAEAHETLLKINTQGDNFKLDGDYSFITADEAYEIYKDIPEAVENTQKVADMVDIDIDTTSWFFPMYPIASDTTHDEELRKAAYAGIAKRGLTETPELVERVEYELDVIKKKGYPSYFLCVADFLTHAKEKGIYAQTRGSAAGSMVAYLIGISNIDPLRYGLLFERFLNPDRPSLPDIDMDFADDRRDEIITYAREKYGEYAVAQIGTFGTMAARGAVRDVARALGFPYSIGDRISKLIPFGSQGFPMTIDKALEDTEELRTLYETDRSVGEIIDMAKKMEGNVRHLSVHAAGVVISPTGRVDDFSPIQYDPKGEGKVITQYDMYSGDREGIINLPKFDFLGLRNLSIMAEALERIEKINGIKIDIEKIPEGDQKTYALFGRGETIGVFQFASDGMQKWLKELKPSNLEDLIAMASLYRPGPMAFIPDYIERKHDPSKIHYLDPRMEAILKNTYGIIVYQEDVMRLATDIAGYTRGESDKFRKAMGKKIPEEMAKQKSHFVEGSIAGGMSKTATEELWSTIETFAAYGFNKSHSAVYALLAYRTAYLKANYPAEYMTALMTVESDNMDNVSEAIAEARRMGFVILPPDVNESYSDFTAVVEDGKVTNKIRFGLGSIKNLGEDIGKAIIHERKQRGPYKSISDFLERVHNKNLNKRSLDSLIKTGAFDAFGERAALLAMQEEMVAYNKDCEKTASQNSLFGDMVIGRGFVVRSAEPATTKMRLDWEKELLGMYVSGHPLDKLRESIEKSKINILKVKEEEKVGTEVVLGCMIESVKVFYTKKGEKMLFLKIVDFTGSMDAVVFPKTLEKYKNVFEEDVCLALKGTINERNGERSILVNSGKVVQ